MDKPGTGTRLCYDAVDATCVYGILICEDRQTILMDVARYLRLDMVCVFCTVHGWSGSYPTKLCVFLLRVLVDMVSRPLHRRHVLVLISANRYQKMVRAGGGAEPHPVRSLPRWRPHNNLRASLRVPACS